jgi:hypothetical protein
MSGEKYDIRQTTIQLKNPIIEPGTFEHFLHRCEFLSYICQKGEKKRPKLDLPFLYPAEPLPNIQEER